MISMRRFFVQYGDDQKLLIRVLMTIVCVFAGVIMVISYFAVKQRIIYINPSQVVGSTTVGYVPDEAASFFAAIFVGFVGNVNSATAFDQYKAAYRLMSPQLQSVMKPTFEDEIEQMGKSDMSVQTTPLSAAVKGDGETFIAEVEAMRVSYVYGQVGKKVKMLYTIHCRKAPTQKSNPFGLVVTSYDSKVLSTGELAATTASSTPN